MKINFRSSHDGFAFSIPLIIGIAFIIFAALIGISQGFVEVGGLLVPELITDMPTFFDYDDVTGDMILDGDGNPAPNERIDLYWLLVSISVIILITVAMVAVLGYIFEIVRWIHPGTAIGIKKDYTIFDCISGVPLCMGYLRNNH